MNNEWNQANPMPLPVEQDLSQEETMRTHQWHYGQQGSNIQHATHVPQGMHDNQGFYGGGHGYQPHGPQGGFHGRPPFLGGLAGSMHAPHGPYPYNPYPNYGYPGYQPNPYPYPTYPNYPYQPYGGTY
ncbi:hypothetical protein [Ornithinibacillus bavariensis]|uniref:hypothetical protein n=1 Tax=Ornithinibacillus bavariensis TaxID=545502 RepID=UPI003D1EC51A